MTKHIYPTVDNYIDTCIKWSEAIWKEFPDVHIGVVGGDKNRRTRDWNKKLSLALQEKFKDKESQIHFILHYYSHFKHPEYDFNTSMGYRKLVAYPMLDLDFKLKNWRWNTTQPFTTWVTEFNMIEQKPYTINNTWAHGLLVSSQINQLLRKTKAEYDNSNTNQYGYEGNNKMGAIQFGLENKINSKKDNYIFYYNVYDREYDERGTIDTYESEVLGLKYDLAPRLIVSL